MAIVIGIAVVVAGIAIWLLFINTEPKARAVEADLNMPSLSRKAGSR
jgi:hypothetical protein